MHGGMAWGCREKDRTLLLCAAQGRQKEIEEK
jgi:hypothetical protein